MEGSGEKPGMMGLEGWDDMVAAVTLAWDLVFVGEGLIWRKLDLSWLAGN
jgi:hypothetical protein